MADVCPIWLRVFVPSGHGVQDAEFSSGAKLFGGQISQELPLAAFRKYPLGQTEMKVENKLFPENLVLAAIWLWGLAQDFVLTFFYPDSTRLRELGARLRLPFKDPLLYMHFFPPQSVPFVKFQVKGKRRSSGNSLNVKTKHALE